MPEVLKSKVVGQDDAVETICKAIRRSRFGLNDPNKPIGSFLMIGSTGVGKTEVAKQIAEYMFGSSDALIRVDMSEYQEKCSASRLGGAPPGYVGYGEGGEFTEKVRRKPYSVILLDEIEKAHPSIYSTFLQILDDGHITDSQGRKVSFKNTIVLMTSNVGAKKLQLMGTGVGFMTSHKVESKEEDKVAVLTKELKFKFPPEFINRLDDVIYFKSLDKDSMNDILDVHMQNFKNILESRDITIEYGEDVQDFIVDKGFDPEYGARPLKRAIQKYVADEITEFLLENEINSSDVLHLSVKEDKLEVIKK